jgi:hypothetical protein
MGFLFLSHKLYNEPQLKKVMPQAVTHILIPLVLSDIYRDYIANNKFNVRYVFAAGIAGLLPDVDILAGWFLNLFSYIPISDLHREFTHSLYFPLIFLALFFLTKNYNPKYLKRQKLKLNYVFLAIAFGSFIHLLLDGGTSLLPLAYFQGTFFQGLDAILLVLWLAHEEYKHRISDYI